jgi:DNA primase
MTSILPTDAQARKEIPIYSGCVAYFPRALAAVAALSFRGNEQHNPGTPLHWDRAKSGDELDALMRHVLEEDWDAVAWRALANLEKKLEEADG